MMLRFKEKHGSKEERYRKYKKDLNGISRDEKYSIQYLKKFTRCS